MEPKSEKSSMKIIKPFIRFAYRETRRYIRFCVKWNMHLRKYLHTWQWRIQGEGAQQARAPTKIGSAMFFLIQFLKIRMLKNKAQIARESIKTILELDPCRKWVRFRSRNVREGNIIFCAPLPQMEILDLPLHGTVKPINKKDQKL